MAITGATIVIALGCVDGKTELRNMMWPAIITLGAALAIADGFVQSGAGEVVIDFLVSTFGPAMTNGRVMVALFLLAGKAYDWNNDRLIAKYTAQLQAMEEARQDDSGEVSENAPSQETLESPPVNVNKETGEISLQITNGQGSLAGDLRTLNNRTYIWRAALWLMRENPQFRIWGTGLTKDMVSSYNNFPVGHTHNSWMEVYVSLGIPGLAIALIFTLTAGLDALFLMFHRRTTMQQKVVCLLVICIMGAGFLEPYLFLSDKSYHFIDFLFFLCIGYMAQWREALRKKK